MRNTFLLFSFFTVLGAFAQPANVKIIDPSVLNGLKPVRKSKGAEAALTSAGITAEEQELVMKYGDDEYWPAGIKTEDVRKKNAASFEVKYFKF